MNSFGGTVLMAVKALTKAKPWLVLKQVIRSPLLSETHILTHALLSPLNVNEHVIPHRVHLVLELVALDRIVQKGGDPNVQQEFIDLSP